MTTESPDGPKRARKSKQTEPAETIPRDVGEFVDTIAHEARSIARLARGLCEADASQESAALIKRPSRALDEGVPGASKSLLDQPLGKILDKKNVHVAEDEAASSVGILATVIESRLKILLEFAQAVKKRNILGTPEGLQFLDEHRAAHYPRIVPLVEATAEHSQLVEEIERLKRDNALIQEEADQFAHDLGQRDAGAESNSSSSSGQPRRHLFGIHIWVAVPLGLLISIVSFGGTGWYSAAHYYSAAEQAERFETRLRAHTANQAERVARWIKEERFQEAMILADVLSIDSPQSTFSESRIDVVMALLSKMYDDYDLAKFEAELHVAEARRFGRHTESGE
ncbi:MAG: hypothetical protein V3T53_02285 [Phycisphaerales bacterium]